jgi:hypothetical protein
MHATREIQESLTGAVDEGMKMLQSFVNGRLTEGSDRDFYGPITGSKLYRICQIPQQQLQLLGNIAADI